MDLARTKEEVIKLCNEIRAKEGENKLKELENNIQKYKELFPGVEIKINKSKYCYIIGEAEFWPLNSFDSAGAPHLCLFSRESLDMIYNLKDLAGHFTKN